MDSMLGSPPSILFVSMVTTGALAALAMVYFSRHRSNDELSPHEDYRNSSLIEKTRIYPVTAGWKIFLFILLGILFLGTVAGAWWFGVIAPEKRDRAQGLVLVLLLSSLATGCLIYLIDTMKSRVVLLGNQIEIHELWRVRRIRRENILTQQILRQSNSPPVLILQLKTPKKRIKLPIMWQVDSDWLSWFASIPDVDVEATKKFEANISADVGLGATPEERKQRLASARQTAGRATWVTGAIVAWSLFYPRPYDLLIAVLLALPWIAIWIMARAPGIYGFNQPRGRGQPDLTSLLIAPGFLLMLRTLKDIEILDWQALLLWAVLITCAVIGTLVWTVPAARQKPAGVLIVLLLMLSYGYGAGATVNALLDRTPPTNYKAQVYGKYVTGGRSHTPELRLGSWGSNPGGDVAVSWDMYRRTRTGDTVCVLLGPGVLSVRWYRIAECKAIS
jgi:hypothetical protein